jgi:hypothetical protein
MSYIEPFPEEEIKNDPVKEKINSLIIEARSLANLIRIAAEMNDSRFSEIDKRLKALEKPNKKSS